MPAALNFTMNSLDGKPVDLSKYQGNVVLMVNVASQCGYTPQYSGLKLCIRNARKRTSYPGIPRKRVWTTGTGHKRRDLGVLYKDCRRRIRHVFRGSSSKGPGQAPLYRFLTSRQTNPKFGGDIDWNFEKFLIGRNGEVIGHFISDVEPLSPEMVGAIEKALATP